MARSYIEKKYVHPRSASFPTVMARMIYVVFGAIISLILMRVLLLMLAANRGNWFVDMIYDLSGALVAPFNTMFNYTPVYGSSVFEVSSVFAILVYALLAWFLIALVSIGSREEEEV